MAQPVATMSIRIPWLLREKLEQEAKKRRLSMNYILVEMLLERYPDVKLE